MTIHSIVREVSDSVCTFFVTVKVNCNMKEGGVEEEEEEEEDVLPPATLNPTDTANYPKESCHWVPFFDSRPLCRRDSPSKHQRQVEDFFSIGTY